VTCVSVTSGNASTGRLLNAQRPPPTNRAEHDEQRLVQRERDDAPDQVAPEWRGTLLVANDFSLAPNLPEIDNPLTRV